MVVAPNLAAETTPIENWLELEAGVFHGMGYRPAFQETVDRRSTGLRRWAEPEIDLVREELVKRSVEEVAGIVHRTPRVIRNLLRC
jgi:hypothetical protein